MLIPASFTNQLAQWLRARFPPGTTAYVLPPSDPDPGAEAGRLSGMNVKHLEPSAWPYPALMNLRWGNPDYALPTIKIQYQGFHDALRDSIAINPQSAGNLVLKEVELNSRVLPATAVADMLVKPTKSGMRCSMLEVKTREYGDLSNNQSYVYALGLVGNHVSTLDARIVQLGFQPLTPLPAMDFLLITCAGPRRRWYPYLVPADVVNVTATMLALQQYVTVVRKTPLTP